MKNQRLLGMLQLKHAFVVAVMMSVVLPVASDAGLFKRIGNAITSPIKKGLNWVGDTFAGPLIDGASAPAIANFEKSGRVLISETDVVLEKRIEQINQMAEARLIQVDGILEKRIGQVDTVMENRIEQVNEVLSVRTDDLDKKLAERISQLDQVAEKRIGNIDIVATKATLGLEASVQRTIRFCCVAALLLLVFWLIYKEGVKSLANRASGKVSVKEAWEVVKVVTKGIWGRALWAAIACSALFLASGLIPSSVSSRNAKLFTKYVNSLDNSLRRLDFNESAFYAAQVKMLDPTSEEVRGCLMRADLIRDFFSRPTLLQTSQGFYTFLGQVKEYERVAKKDDSLALGLKGLALMRVAKTKQAEHYAAVMLAQSIERSEGKGLIDPISYHYLANYLAFPASKLIFSPVGKDYTDAFKRTQNEVVSYFSEDPIKVTPDELAEKFKSLPDLAEKIPAAFSNYVAYNEMVRSLKLRSNMKYIELARSLGDPSTAARAKAAATELVTQWAGFENALAQNSSFIVNPQFRLAAFKLGDAQQSRGLVYQSAASYEPGLKNFILDKQVMRAKNQKAVEDLFAAMPNVKKCIFAQETFRFESVENELLNFEISLLAFQVSRTKNDPMKLGNSLSVARWAAAADLYTPVESDSAEDPQKPLQPYAEVLLKEGDVDEAVWSKNTFAADFEQLLIELNRRTNWFM